MAVQIRRTVSPPDFAPHSIVSRYRVPDGCNQREQDPQAHDEQGNLEPDQAANLPEHEFDSTLPGVRDFVADALDGVLQESLRAVKSSGHS